MEFHEAANIFPMEEDSIAELSADIAKRGQLVPIELLGGKIIDGRRRWTADQRAGVIPITRELDPAKVPDPVAYVLSLNLHRRHLTPSQRAMVGARAREIYDREAKDRQKIAGGDRKSEAAKSLPVLTPEAIPRGDSRDLAGRAVGVGGTTIDKATKVLKKGTAELIASVDAGEMPVYVAARIIDTPHPESDTEKDVAKESPQEIPKPEQRPAANKEDGKAILIANEAINLLMKIRPDNPRRAEAYRIVQLWIRKNL
jgi:ParB-like chromosome segregation protein Spo0J